MLPIAPTSFTDTAMSETGPVNRRALLRQADTLAARMLPAWLDLGFSCSVISDASLPLP